jgi:hypothetical protein
MLPNGPAIKGGCVTRRQHRAPRVLGAGTLASWLSRRAPREPSEQRGCKEGMARVFVVRVLSWLCITSVAVQIILRIGNYPTIVILLTVVARSGFVKHYDSV